MDIGVGAFVFSQGMVSHHRQRSLSFRKACLSSLPLFFLGFVRLMLVKASNYQEHVSEYGLHWNFFFTLAFLPPFVVLCRRLLNSNLDEAVVGLVVTLLHQAMLSFGQWEQWVLKAPRETWISANKEGLCSLFGMFHSGSDSADRTNGVRIPCNLLLRCSIRKVCAPTFTSS